MTPSDALVVWLRRVGIETGSAGLPGPGWFSVADLSALRAAASRVEAAADTMDETRARLHKALGQTAVSLGWQGQAAVGAAARSQRTGAQLADLADLLRRLGRALARHALAVEDWREEIRGLLAEAEDHVAAAGDALAASHPFTVVADVGPRPDGGSGHVAALNRCAGRIREVLADAEAQDRACASQVVDLGAAVLDLAGRAEADDWLGDVVPSGAREVLSGLGIIPPPGHRSVAD